VGDDRLWGVNRRRKGTANTLAALKSIRAARLDGAPIHVILANPFTHRREHPPLGEEEQVRAVLYPDLRFLSQPDRGPLRPAAAVPATAATPRKPRYYTATCAGAIPTPATPDALTAQRKERARTRSEKGIRWGGRPLNTAA
jgi:hypothetical protein